MNTAIFSGDADFALDTVCNRRVDHVPNGVGGYVDGVCDPSGGYSYTRNTLDNFGKINLKRGHRVIELVVKVLTLPSSHLKFSINIRSR